MPATEETTRSVPSRQIEFNIFRYQPKRKDPPRFDSFRLEVNSTMVVLDCLAEIRLKLDESLVYRHSCHHSACGTCALRINGVERLACTTRVLELERDTVCLEPLRGFELLGDLAVDMRTFYCHIDADWPLLRPAEPLAGQLPSEEQPSPWRLQDCIECGACVSACPVTQSANNFMGPAALAAISDQIFTVAEAGRMVLLQLADKPDGQRHCERALACSRVCPTQVYPARHIADLRKKLGLTLDGKTPSNGNV